VIIGHEGEAVLGMLGILGKMRFEGVMGKRDDVLSPTDE